MCDWMIYFLPLEREREDKFLYEFVEIDGREIEREGEKKGERERERFNFRKVNQSVNWKLYIHYTHTVMVHKCMVSDTYWEALLVTSTS